MSNSPARVLQAVLAIFVAFSSSLIAQTRPDRVVQILATFDYPGASSTIAHGINHRGDVTGDFVAFDGVQSFIRYQKGIFSAPIVHPDDTDGQTYGADINRNAIVGYRYDLTNSVLHSYGLSNNIFTNLDLPGAVSTAAPTTSTASPITPSRIRRIAVETKSTDRPVAAMPANGPTRVPVQR